MMSLFKSILSGAAAGFVATAPMTLVMDQLHRRLPRQQRYPLPPRTVTTNVLSAVGAEDYVSSKPWDGVTLASHFAYGAACGAILGAVSSQVRVPPLAGGIAWGLAVWSGSYLGWLPAAGLHCGAAREPAARNGLMIAAHVVWGAATGTLMNALEDSSDGSRLESRATL